MSTIIDVADGKYSVVIGDDGSLSALRYGESWRDLTGDKLVYCLAAEIDRLRNRPADYLSDGLNAFPVDIVNGWASQNKARMTIPLVFKEVE